MKPAVLTGEHFMTGDVACAEGALAAGCLFFGGYPITPATDLVEWLSPQIARLGGRLTLAEDELAAINMVVGASFAGAHGGAIDGFLEAIGERHLGRLAPALDDDLRGDIPPGNDDQ